MTGFFSYIWSGISGIFKIIFGRQNVNPNTNGLEFVTTFRQEMRRLGANEAARVRFYERAFIDMCTRARGQRKPILVFMLRASDDETMRYT